MEEKLILDACCGSRMFWFDKNNPIVVYMDNRQMEIELTDSSSKSGKRTLMIKPDIIADFTEMPFKSSSFKVVSFDPPHLKTLGQNSWMALKYGVLKGNWRKMISDGFDECFRVLEDYGVLVFKWNESEVKVSEILSLIPYKPLFGHTTGRQSKTIWMLFLKIPNHAN